MKTYISKTQSSAKLQPQLSRVREQRKIGAAGEDRAANLQAPPRDQPPAAPAAPLPGRQPERTNRIPDQWSSRHRPLPAASNAHHTDPTSAKAVAHVLRDVRNSLHSNCGTSAQRHYADTSLRHPLHEDEPILLTVRQTGYLLSLGRSRVYELMNQRLIDSVSIRNRNGMRGARRILRESVIRYCNSLA